MEIGLFPLGMVLLPAEQVPLHVFEPRYRELIGECLEQSAEFGLVLADEDGLRGTGTTAAVVEVLERFPDGRLDIVVEGRERFEIVEETAGRSFRTATIEPAPDDEDGPTPDERERCVAAFRTLAEAADAEPDEPGAEVDDVSYWIAMRVDFGTEVKQELLEERSPRRRAVRLVDLLGRARTTLAWARMASERAATNGRVEPPG